MKTNSIKTKQNKGFTLIEMIGVLAVIAILAALLIPKVFQAITEARINTVPVGAATCKTGTIDHYAKWGGLAASPYGTNYTVPSLNYDTTVLLAEGFIDKPFAPRVGTNAFVQLIDCGDTTDAVDGGGINYDLDGSGTTPNDAPGTHLVEAVVQGVPVADAQAISARIDGVDLSQPENDANADLRGRVIYAAGTTVDVYIYLTHR